MNAEIRATINEGRYVPVNPWVHYFGKRYRVRGDRVEVFYYRYNPRTGVERAVYRDLKPGTRMYRIIKRAHAAINEGRE